MKKRELLEAWERTKHNQGISELNEVTLWINIWLNSLPDDAVNEHIKHGLEAKKPEWEERLRGETYESQHVCKDEDVLLLRDAIRLFRSEMKKLGEEIKENTCEPFRYETSIYEDVCFSVNEALKQRGVL